MLGAAQHGIDLGDLFVRWVVAASGWAHEQVEVVDGLHSTHKSGKRHRHRAAKKHGLWSMACEMVDQQAASRLPHGPPLLHRAVGGRCA